MDAPDFPIAPVGVALGVDTVFVASDGVNVALLALTDGYGDWVGNVTPLNASTMNVTELFMYGVPGRSYVRCGKNDVPFPHICLVSLFDTPGMTHRIARGAVLPQPRLQYRPQWRRQRVIQSRVAEHYKGENAVLDARADVGHDVMHDEGALRIADESEALVGASFRLIF